ncbi:NUDIX hydrolase [Aquamicrobium segne]|uniref:NUDIX hydrolase n=1 Tax=Aquamicrobium segne TaxID=469547 RepID=A0ABW0H157_9HYPH
MFKAGADQAHSAPVTPTAPSLQPCDAATLILVDRQGKDFKVLMGRRHSGHVFMPGKFVFPGGRTDPGDGHVPVAKGLHPYEEAKLSAHVTRTTPARAIALSAIRETYEEAGFLVGNKGAFSFTRPDWQGFAEHGVIPSLHNLRFVARAITPPGWARRFDTRFFAGFRDSIAVELPQGGPSNELEDLLWLTFDQALQLDLAMITRTILKDIQMRLACDPDLAPGGPVPFYQSLNNCTIRTLL